MPLYAVDDLGDALEATREFLLPFDAGRWVRLAVVAFFVSSGTGGMTPPSGFQYQFDAAPGATPAGDVPVEVAADALDQYAGLVIAVAIAAVLVGLAFAWLAATMEFVLLDALRSGELRVRRNVRRFAWKGTRLFAFRIALGLLGAGVVAALAAFALAPLASDGGGAAVVTLLAFVPVVFAVVFVLGAVYAFTTAFVVPVMLLEDRGVVSAWRRFWPVLRDDWRQYAVAAGVGLLLLFAAGIAVSVASAILAIPFAVLIAAVVFASGGVLDFGVIAALALAFALVAIVVVAVVQVPVQTYLRYWAVLVLGDTDPDLDLVPDLRAEIRAETE